ncbi:MAG: multifunctional CCA addition/repair protein [Burkholderiaceae bacterium]
MKAYVVGGAVRDALLGHAGSDKDWVVVGSTPEQMIAQGFIPVGRDFPVFLHPHTKQEYALARTERKTAPGYHGFTFHADAAVTLEQDLARRDLTINAMAFDECGALVDPYGGRADLDSRVLRHVSPAFAEDPVRILRLARFAARWPDFSVAPQTLDLARRMVDAGEVDALVPERVWQELARGLMESRPSRMLRVLRDCRALARLLPEVEHLESAEPGAAVPTGACAAERLMRALDIAATLSCPLAVRFACLGQGVAGRSADAVPRSEPSSRAEPDSAPLAALCRRLRVPVECRELAEVMVRELHAVLHCQALDAAALLRLLERCDALRRPERFEALLLACECVARAAQAAPDAAFAQRAYLQRVLQSAIGVATPGIAARAAELGVTGPGVGQAIHEARAQAIALAQRRPS